MYARQLAWYTGKAPGDKPLSRIEWIQQRGGKATLPPLKEEAYLADIWKELGMIGPDRSRLESTEIESWARQSGWTLNPWEFDAIRAMSAAYIAEIRNSADPHNPAPFGNPYDSYDRAKVASSLRSALKAFKR